MATRYTAEGGAIPNGVAEPPVTKKYISFEELSRLMQVGGWGRSVTGTGNREEEVSAYIRLARESLGSVIEEATAGAVLRIAAVVERLEPLLKIALGPLAAAADRELREWQNRQWDRVNAKIQSVEAKCGPCPERLRRALRQKMGRYLRNYTVANRIFIHQDWVQDSIRSNGPVDAVKSYWPKRTKLHQEYVRWRKRRVRRSEP